MSKLRGKKKRERLASRQKAYDELIREPGFDNRHPSGSYHKPCSTNPHKGRGAKKK